LVVLVSSFISSQTFAATGSGEVLEAAGSWDYSVPIEVPEYRGVEPHLALHYNSSNPNGIVGMGWSLTGFSEITRSSPDFLLGKVTFYLDGQPVKISRTASKRVAFGSAWMVLAVRSTTSWSSVYGGL
jgi:hypothetical protein